jgi:hypothetical protein
MTTARQTTVAIEGEDFHINNKPTYPGRRWQDHRIEGLLLNSRMVQGIFDDLNPETRSKFDYPDGPWDPDRNTNQFLASMATWREHGLLSFTINLQGGSPEGYSPQQPWHNSAFEADGKLRPDYMARLQRILDRADELGMAPIVGLFYFGQDERLADETAVLDATRNAVAWLVDRGYTHVLIEVNNECNVPKYEHEILQPHRVHELIDKARQWSDGRFKVGTSMGGGALQPDNIVAVSDFILLHGNGVGERGGPGHPQRITEMIDQTRAAAAYRGQPIVFNEDDHYGFDEADNNMLAAVRSHASWGCFDWRYPGEGFEQGYQSVPCDWGLSSDRKQGFFLLMKEITGA